MIYVYNKGHGRGRIELGRGGARPPRPIYHIFIVYFVYIFATALSQFKNFSAVFSPEKVTLKMKKCMFEQTP